MNMADGPRGSRLGSTNVQACQQTSMSAKPACQPEPTCASGEMRGDTPPSRSCCATVQAMRSSCTAEHQQ